MKKQISSILFIALLSCLIVLCALSAFATEDAEMWLDEKAPLDDYAYSMAIIGDTQKVSYLTPDNMSKIYDYIIDNAEAKNIKFVMGLGDITDQNMESEWVNDMAQIKRMDGILLSEGTTKPYRISTNMFHMRTTKMSLQAHMKREVWSIHIILSPSEIFNIW